MRENYKNFSSPLTKLTKRLCDKLNAKNTQVRFDFIHLYVSPFVNEVLEKYHFKKDDEIILFPLYPHHSKTTIETSINSTKKEFLKQNLNFKVVDIFYKNEEFNALLIDQILQKKRQYPSKNLILSAHSLPLSHIKKGDLYEKQINEHVKILKEALKDEFENIILAYQSKLGPVKWLEPSIDEVLKSVNGKSLIYPLSFCIDNAESVYELGVMLKNLGDYELIECLNDNDEFVKFILKMIEK